MNGNCQECVLTRILCIDCEQEGVCDPRYKPKITPSNRQALSLYGLCQKFGVLPKAGGVLDQSAKLMTQFEIIMDEIAKQDEIERKKLKNG